MLEQAEVNARMLPWGDAEFRRFEFRTGLFGRRGLEPGEAERIADRLALRDQERDERRMCIECQHLQQRGGCFQHQQGRLTGASKFFQPMPLLLQRCPSFNFQTP